MPCPFGYWGAVLLCGVLMLFSGVFLIQEDWLLFHFSF